MEQTANYQYQAHRPGQRGPVDSLQLLVVDGNDQAQLFILSEGKELHFGKAGDNQIVIDSGTVSRHHGSIGIKNGLCIIRDFNSTNGLQVNGRWYRDCSLELSVGDVVRIGNNKSRDNLGAMLALSESGGQWRQYPLPQGSTIIGRGEGSNIRLNHVAVSRRHAELFRDENGLCFIENFGTNGTLIDGRILRGRIQLQNRSSIQIAGTELYLCGGNLYYYQALGGLRLEARGLTRDVKSHSTTKRILNDVSFTIEPGEFVAIVGGSGCGKSTLLNALTGYERATAGSVLVGDKSLYQNYDYFKSIMGFVPQQDIVYDHLELQSMLEYTARLRMPKDTSPQERQQRVREVLEMVELKDYAGSMVKKLSGGQRKRASIAVELLADPGLFYLDEPTSGLDPGTERNLMHTLRRLATQKRKTVIMVTHTTLNLNMCDKIIFMGKGGRLCFCGTPQDALRFFGVDNFVDIYNLVAADTERWHQAFVACKAGNKGKAQAESPDVGRVERPGFFKQTGILAQRYLNLICNDRSRLLLLLAEPVVMGLILYICKSDEVFETYIATKNIFFTYVCCAIWIGIFNSVQEICKERAILKREYMANLRLGAYISSKFLVQALLCLAQSILLFSVFSLLVGLPEEGIFLDSAVPEMLLTTFLTILSASCMGLCLSAVSNNPDKAMTLSPFLLVVQLVFAGIIFQLEGLVEAISYATLSRWSISALGVSAGLEEMYDSFALTQSLLGGSSSNDATAELFEYTQANLCQSWLILFGFCLLFCIAAIVLLRNISRDSR